MKAENRKLRTEKGQALVELAVFGMFLIMILGVLINYGMRYNLQQEASMIAFRRALKIASDPNRGSGAYMISHERSIPEATDMFGIGSKMPITASASVTRDYKMHAQTADVSSLSGIVMDIQTKREGDYQTWIRRMPKSAGFRVEYGVIADNLPKYQLIYGSIVAKKGIVTGATGSESGGLPPPPAGHPSSWEWVSVNSNDVERICIASHMVPIYAGYGDAVGQTPVCDQMAISALRILDSCVGEMIDYGSCYTQSRMMVDVDYCTSECNRQDGADCATKCALKTLPPNQTDKIYKEANGGGAWYASNYTYASCVTLNGTYDTCYTFPILKDGLFAFTGGAPKMKSMGMQSDSTSDITRSEYFTRDETDSGITTMESMTAQDTTHKSLIGQYNLDAQGYDQRKGNPKNYVNVETENVDSTVVQTVEETWHTSK